jgi:hypothetical protein
MALKNTYDDVATITAANVLKHWPLVATIID